MEKPKVGFKISEDWLAGLIAFGLILLSAIGILGKKWGTYNILGNDYGNSSCF